METLTEFLRRRGWAYITSRKIVVKIPGGEVQYGRLSGTLSIWFRGKVRHRVMRRV